jgi:uncharacterized protein (DUF697 family)
MPVLGVITKARTDQGFRAEVQRLLPATKNVVRVRAFAEVLDDGHTLAPMGLTELVDLTAEVIPEGVRRAFVAGQKVSLQQKKNQAHAIVASAAAVAGVAGASPIPFSNWFILAPIQIGMLAGITSVFGLQQSTAFLTTLVAASAGATGASFAGRSIVANLLKLIPGGGTLAGGAISATTAVLLTSTLGELYVATLVALFKETGGEAPDSDLVLREFKRQLGGDVI